MPDETRLALVRKTQAVGEARRVAHGQGDPAMMSDDEYFNDPRIDELGRALAHANEVNAQLRATNERLRAASFAHGQAVADYKMELDAVMALRSAPGPKCEAPPAGWWCSRPSGHDGPCAARPS